MKFCFALGLVVLAGVALGSTFRGTSSAPKGMVTSPISQRINVVVGAAEKAYRQNPEAVAENSTLAKADIEKAIAKVVGQRVSMSLKVDEIQTRDGKTILIGKIPVNGELVWDRESELQVEMRRRDLEDALNTKLKPPVIRTEVERLQDRIEAAKQAYRLAQSGANERAAARIPDVAIETECAELPPGVRKGMKASLMGWISEIQVRPVVKSDIAYAGVSMKIIHQGAVNAAFATSRPAVSVTTRPAESQPATQTSTMPE